MCRGLLVQSSFQAENGKCEFMGWMMRKFPVRLQDTRVNKMPRALKDFTTCDPNPLEATIFGLDFALDLAVNETITGVTFWCNVAETSDGTDATPSARLLGSPSIGGTVVSQMGGTFIEGVTYRIGATITTSQGQIISGWANTTCEAVTS